MLPKCNLRATTLNSEHIEIYGSTECSGCSREVKVGEIIVHNHDREEHGYFADMTLCTGCLSQALQSLIDEAAKTISIP